MINVDIAIIGSGVAALRMYKDASEQGFSTLLIDIGPLGGSLSSIGALYKFPKIPILFDYDIRKLFDKCNFMCYSTKLYTIKTGSIIDKIKGFEKFEAQRLWIFELLNKKELCFINDVISCIISTLKLSHESIKKIEGNVRRIYVDSRTIMLSTGLVIKYKELVYTWPLTMLGDLIVTKNKELKLFLDKLVNELKYSSLFIRSYIVEERNDNENVISLYIHATKASRLHTIIKIPLAKNTHLFYAITSYSKNYPLLPGIGEKIDSELRKHKLFTNITKILEFNNINIVYGVLNKIDKELINLIKNALLPYNIKLFGRVAEWIEYDIPTIIFKSRPG
ncbi:hypothetical protein QPL79_00120 [Ignisphaera sp. 4213-co]|uniref:FAD-binding oxidoreductase n=1 Tax=Ignisphaera cupida TaxID=3050454 RepID=A0ABD4Z4E2_9CREN|nr:hypothetical protein [Ignisphaera sp. 4213-co]MDK6027780.1 hypothetical protein [Ignisphaera sp. 4213-co]